MPLTITDVFERLKHYDELDLLDELGISSEDIVERFPDFIEDKLDHFLSQLEWDTDYDNQEKD